MGLTPSRILTHLLLGGVKRNYINKHNRKEKTLTDTDINTILNEDGFNNELSRAIVQPHENDDLSLFSRLAYSQWCNDWNDLGVAYGKALAGINQMAQHSFNRQITFANLGKVFDAPPSYAQVGAELDKVKSDTPYTYLGYAIGTPRNTTMDSATISVNNHGGIGIFANGGIVVYVPEGAVYNFATLTFFKNALNNRFDVDLMIHDAEAPSKENLEFIDSSIEKIKKQKLEGIKGDIEYQEKTLEGLQGKLKAEEAIIEQLQPMFDKGIVSNDVKFLSKFPQVKSVRVLGNKLIIHTNVLHLRVTDPEVAGGVWKDITVPLGEMEIIAYVDRLFKTASLRECLVINNLTNMNRPHPHPHIRDTNCFNQWEDRLQASRNNTNLVDIIDTIIGFLTTFNPQDAWGYEGITAFDPERKFGNMAATIREEQGEYDEDNNWRPYYEGENGGYIDGEWEWYIFDGADMNAAWDDYQEEYRWIEEGVNGDRETGHWQFYQEGRNGIYEQDGTWTWYQEGTNGYWDDYAENFTFYRDDEDFTQNENGDWVEIEELENNETEMELV